jgi:hypothetical protein
MCNFIQTRVAISASPFREGTVLRGAVSKETPTMIRQIIIAEIGFQFGLRRLRGCEEGDEMKNLKRDLIWIAVAAVAISGIAFVPTPAEAAKLSNAERVALEKATAACKSEAKGMKFSWHWRKRQKYVQDCIIRSASKQGIDIWEVRRAVNMKDLPSQEVDDWSFVFSRSRHR